MNITLIIPWGKSGAGFLKSLLDILNQILQFQVIPKFNDKFSILPYSIFYIKRIFLFKNKNITIKDLSNEV